MQTEDKYLFITSSTDSLQTLNNIHTSTKMNEINQLLEDYLPQSISKSKEQKLQQLVQQLPGASPETIDLLESSYRSSVHALFKEPQWSNNIDELTWFKLRPAFVLASRFLVSPRSIAFMHSLLFEPRTTEACGTRQIIEGNMPRPAPCVDKEGNLVSPDQCDRKQHVSFPIISPDTLTDDEVKRVSHRLKELVAGTQWTFDSMEGIKRYGYTRPLPTLKDRIGEAGDFPLVDCRITIDIDRLNDIKLGRYTGKDARLAQYSSSYVLMTYQLSTTLLHEIQHALNHASTGNIRGVEPHHGTFEARNELGHASAKSIFGTEKCKRPPEEYIYNVLDVDFWRNRVKGTNGDALKIPEEDPLCALRTLFK